MNKLHFIKNSITCTKIFFRLEPKGACFYVTANILYALFWMLQTVSLQFFFDTAETAALQPDSLRPLIGALFLMGGTYLGYHILDGINNGYCDILLLKLWRGLNNMLFQRVSRMNTIEFEDSQRLDALEKAKNGSQCLPGIVFTLLDILFCYITYFLFIGSYLFAQNPMLICCILVVFVPELISKLATAAMYQKEENQEAPLRRQIDHYERCLTKKEFLKETRIWGANSFFETRYRDSLQKQIRLKLQVLTRKHLLRTILNAITACGYGLIVWMLFSSVLQKEITLGTFVAVLTTLGHLFRCMNKMVSERLGWAADNIGIVENFLSFLAEDLTPGPAKMQDSGKALTLEHVSFSYPQSPQNALSDISLTIPAGQTIALVGENGSGKSTLAKLLLGLYEPSQGQVLYDNSPLFQCSPARISAVFQKYQQYQMTLGENLTISAQFQTDDAKLRALCQDCGIPLTDPAAETPSALSLNSMLGREFDGTDLSGGQWQRIAIGRGIYKSHDLIVLDEPTAAIDPLEETRIYHQFAQLCHDKTAVLITHRLGAARLADRILVLEQGKLVQDGTHEELLGADGPYRKMYEAQSAWY